MSQPRSAIDGRVLGGRFTQVRQPPDPSFTHDQRTVAGLGGWIGRAALDGDQALVDRRIGGQEPQRIGLDPGRHFGRLCEELRKSTLQGFSPPQFRSLDVLVFSLGRKVPGERFRVPGLKRLGKRVDRLTNGRAILRPSVGRGGWLLRRGLAAGRVGQQDGTENEACSDSHGLSLPKIAKSIHLRIR